MSNPESSTTRFVLSGSTDVLNAEDIDCLRIVLSRIANTDLQVELTMDDVVFKED